MSERPLSRGRDPLKVRGRRLPAAPRLKPAARDTGGEAPEADAPAPVDEAPDDPVLFVSYSHTDAEWVADAERHLRNVAGTCGYRLFIDRGIRAGEAWPA